MHRVTEERGLIESANGSIAKDAEPWRSTAKGAATSALTKYAFSWKFVGSTRPVPGPIETRSSGRTLCAGSSLARIAPWRGILRRYAKADGFGLSKGKWERLA
jgi:hypothetical protein